VRICIVVNATAFALSLMEHDAFFACMSFAALVAAICINNSMRKVTR